jgi:hypothetical protein
MQRKKPDSPGLQQWWQYGLVSLGDRKRFHVARVFREGTDIPFRKASPGSATPALADQAINSCGERNNPGRWKAVDEVDRWSSIP